MFSDWTAQLCYVKHVEQRYMSSRLRYRSYNRLELIKIRCQFSQPSSTTTDWVQSYENFAFQSSAQNLMIGRSHQLILRSWIMYPHLTIASWSLIAVCSVMYNFRCSAVILVLFCFEFGHLYFINLSCLCCFSVNVYFLFNSLAYLSHFDLDIERH